MANVSTLFDSRWLSAKHVGVAKPYLWVGVRRGYFTRSYTYWGGGDVNAVIPNGANATWVATWTPVGDYVEVPNVFRVQLQQDFNQNGITVLTLDIENVIYKSHIGPSGLTFHTIERGYLAPMRGYVTPSRQVPPVASANEWSMLFERNAQILVKAGYGADTAVPVFTGLVDKHQGTGNPARLTVSGRDFGKTLADQYTFGWVKDKGMRDPITFADRRGNDKTFTVGGGARASDHQQGHPASHVTDSSLSSSWRSRGYDDSNHQSWVEIHLPEGRYEDFFLAPLYENQEVFVSLYATTRSRNRRPTFNGVAQPEGWMNVVTKSHGSVPGDGEPYVRHLSAAQRRPRQYSLLGSFVVGDNSILRLTFRRMQRSRESGRYHAGVRTLKAIRRQRDKDAVKNKWILIDDLSDIVKVVLRWAGFKEWDVEDTGVRLQKNDTIVFNRNQHLIDLIKKVQDLTGYVFFIGDPSNDSTSIGVPTFRRTRAMEQNPGALRGVTDGDLLTSVTTSYDDQNLATIIRARGAIGKKNDGARKLGGDTALRYMGHYYTPWRGRMAGLIKHVVHYEPLLTSDQQCKMMAILIALNEALSSATATIECPGNPAIELDGQFAVVDTATGVSSRLYVTNRTQVFQTGAGTSGGTTGAGGTSATGGVSLSRAMAYAMTLEGALLDTPDVQNVLRDLSDFTGDNEGNDTATVINGRPTIVEEPGRPTIVGEPPLPSPAGIDHWPLDAR